MDAEVAIYTDGACERNPGRGGWAAILESGTLRKQISGGVARSTNNRMELRAVIEGLRALKKDRLTVRVVTDSQYVAYAVMKGWLKKWVADGFKKGDALRENHDLWRELHSLLSRHRVRFEWVEGHAGHLQNEECDRLSIEARLRPDLPDDVAYLAVEQARIPEFPDAPTTSAS